VHAVKPASGAQVLDRVWRFEASHPEWTEDEGGEDGWEQNVAWWAIASPRGLILVDPLVFEWSALDRLVEDHQGCAGIIRTCHWHQRSIAEGAIRYGAGVWALSPTAQVPRHPYDHAVTSGQEILEAVLTFEVERADEIALWLSGQSALIFGDAMLRTEAGELRICPPSWLAPEGGPARLRGLLGELAKLPVKHVLVSHGPLVLDDGSVSLKAAIR